MKKIIRILLMGLLCSVLLPSGAVEAHAAVYSTPEAAGGADCIYVAGNPDWYPVEYYNADTGQYEGVLPAILERVGEQTGLNFTYILAGPEDQRLRLARNGQVEMVSGYGWDAAELADYSMSASRILLTVPRDGQRVEVCFAFTEIAGADLIQAVEGALDTLSGQEIAEITAGVAVEHTGRHYPRWVLPVGAGVLVLLLAVIVVLARQRRRYKNAVHRSVHYDLATGIRNKEYFVERFEKLIPDQYRELYCVVFIGFDIARVNQYYGESEAEDQLRFAANELMKTARDDELAARVSGGGFAVARPSSGEREIETWTQELLQRLNQYSEKYGKNYHPEFCAGIYMLQQSDRDAETALFNARQGYQLAVSSGVEYAFARTQTLRAEAVKLQLKKQTPQAIQNQEFQMFLQFVVRGDNGKIVGAEALSRWEHPQKGLLHPGSYIGLMESEGTIGELDFYIFEEACRQLERWQKEGRKLSLSCNFTRLTINQKDFVSRLKEIADRYFFDRFYLVVEITEDIMENNKKIAFSNVSQCKELGFRIALDDLGSGYTSFADLRDYPIDVVKIDRSLLNFAVNPHGIALLRGVIALAHSLQMKVLCEGVETIQQVELLRGLDCDYMQGYYFYRVLPTREASRYLRENADQIET